MPHKNVVLLETGAIMRFSDEDFPLVIHGAPKTGASHFSLSVVADLFARGRKLLLFTAFPAAREDFLAQTAELGRKAFDVTDPSQIPDASGDAIIVKSGDVDLFVEALKRLPDLAERIVFIKNVEALLTPEMIDLIRPLSRLVLSGDFDAAPLGAEAVRVVPPKTKVLLSPSKVLDVPFPALEKYVGYLDGRMSGAVTLR